MATKTFNMKRLLERIIYTKWKVIRTTWPYPSGYGTYRTKRFTGEMTVLDTGLTREMAYRIVEELNK